VSVAHIPLDLRFVSRRAVALFSTNRDLVSLSVHGNTHDGGELGRLPTDLAASAHLGAAVHRVARFERVYGLPIDRVMVPPHEAATEAVVRCLPAWGFEALTMTRPYGFLYPLGTASAFAAPGSDVAGFGPADLVGPTVPVLTRRLYSETGEIPLRGFLGQPIILYGHAEDFCDGLTVLEGIAAAINDLPSVRWGSLQSITRRSYETKAEPATLRVRPLASRLEIDVPAGTTSIVVEALPGTRGNVERIEVGLESSQIVHWSAPSFAHTALVGRRSLPRPMAVVRRVLTEGRDRLHPLFRRQDHRR
jgi:hypothetical protein